MEIIRHPRPLAAPKVALFDFDGTLSLIVAGWRETMIAYFIDELRDTPRGADESEDELLEAVIAFVDLLTGKPTIYQCMRIAKEIEARGKKPREAIDYKKEYSARIKPVVDARLETLRNGTKTPAEHMVRGSLDLLRLLRERGVVLYLASGSSVGFVKEECELLGITHFFQEKIYGALPDPEAFSKAKIIELIFKERKIAPAELIGFGDGHTETENVHAVGGFAVGVASDETGAGRVEPVKRRLLIDSGADIIIPDYRDAEQLVARLF